MRTTVTITLEYEDDDWARTTVLLEAARCVSVGLFGRVEAACEAHTSPVEFVSVHLIREHPAKVNGVSTCHHSRRDF